MISRKLPVLRISMLLCSILVLGLLPTACEAPPETPAAGITNPPAHSSYDAEVRQLLAQMTLAEKIGQMTQAEQAGLVDPADIETYFLGSVLSGGGVEISAGNDSPAMSASPLASGSCDTPACKASWR